MQLLGREMEVKHQIFQLDIVVPLEQADVMEVEGAHLASSPSAAEYDREQPANTRVKMTSARSLMT